MLSYLRYLWKYSSLYNLIRKYTNQYQTDTNHRLLDQIISQINDCGPVAIKLTQWILPKIELIITDSVDIQHNKKLECISKLETLYENCMIHDMSITKQMYQQSFQKDFDCEYRSLDILGSGSIGQAHLIQNKTTLHKYVMKIIHPRVREDIIYFKKCYLFLKYFLNCIPCVDNYIDLFPFDLEEFIKDFTQQSDFINESNNLLQFHHYFEKNPFIIIPKLYKCSNDIIIMSHEEGSYVDDLVNIEDNYLKYNISILYYLFVNNNEQSYHFNHGDLHKGNWRYRIEDNKPRLVIYDFGFCFTIPEDKRYIVEMIVDTFEKTDKINILDDKMIDTLTTISKEILIGYELSPENLIRLRDHISVQIKELKPWCFSPVSVIKIFINFSIQERCKIDHLLLQFFIIAIQSTQLYEQFSFKGSEETAINGREVYRERYLDVINFCNTYQIFPEYKQLIQKKLTLEQPDVSEIFDTIHLSDEIKTLALS